MKEIKYALKYKKTNQLLYYSCMSNEGADFCGDRTYSLSTYGDKVWYIDDAIQAEYVRRTSTPWYNANYETPMHNYKANELAVVKVKIITNMKEIKIDFPSYEEVAKFKANGNKNDYEFYLKQKRDNPKVQFAFYDITEYFMKKKENLNEKSN